MLEKLEIKISYRGCELKGSLDLAAGDSFVPAEPNLEAILNQDNSNNNLS